MRGGLEDFAGEVFEPFAPNDQRRWGEVYVPGLLTDGKRKSVEPMSARSGEAVPVTGDYSGMRRPPVAQYPDKPQSVKQMVIAAGGKAAKPVRWREGSCRGMGRSGLKRMYSRFVTLRIRPAGREIACAIDGPVLAECWLLAEWPATEDEPVQFWLSDLPADTPLTTLVRPAKLRCRIEHDYREMKQALGLAHFEGRTWNGWHHHVTLVSVAHAFCTLQRLARAPKGTAPA
ncbi:transposase [Streptomyces sioyaensis]|uniref:transposase n=1 Tax=Streptomyces sioyaensis TaxID=67364 RepID=UPI0037A571F6